VRRSAADAAWPSREVGQSESDVFCRKSAVSRDSPRASAWAATFTPISARRGCLGRRGLPATDTAELCEPRGSRKHRGKQTGNTQIEVQVFPVQATASTKDLDGPDMLGTSAPEIWYQLNRQRDCSPVRERDLQRALRGVVHDGAGSWFCSCCTPPGTGRPSEILPQLLLYPSNRRL